MTNDFFNNSFKMFTDPGSYNTWMSNMSKFDWESWSKNLNENFSKSFSHMSPEMLEHIQGLAKHNMNFMQQNIIAYLDNVKENMSAANLEEIIANQYKLFKELSLNYTEHAKDMLQNVMNITSGVSSEVLN